MEYESLRKQYQVYRQYLTRGLFVKKSVWDVKEPWLRLENSWEVFLRRHSTLWPASLITLLISFRDMAATLDCQERCLLSADFRENPTPASWNAWKEALELSWNPTGIIRLWDPESERPSVFVLFFFFLYCPPHVHHFQSTFKCLLYFIYWKFMTNLWRSWKFCAP